MKWRRERRASEYLADTKNRIQKRQSNTSATSAGHRSALAHRDVAVRREAARLLRGSRDPETVRALCAALDRETEHIWGESAAGFVVEALVDSGGGWVVEDTLRRQLHKTTTWNSSDYLDMTMTPGWDSISVALLNLGGPEALLRGLFEVLDNPLSPTKDMVSRQLSQIAYTMRHKGTISYLAGSGTLDKVTESVRDALLTRLYHMLDDPSSRTRADAIAALRNLGDRRAIEPLRQLNDSVNRSSIERAIRDLT